MPEEPLLQLGIKIDRLCQGVETVKERQEMVASDVSKIKEAVYNPDSGLYARLRALEQWKESQAKVQWVTLTTILGLTIATIYKAIFTI